MLASRVRKGISHYSLKPAFRRMAEMRFLLNIYICKGEVRTVQLTKTWVYIVPENWLWKFRCRGRLSLKK